VFASSVRERSRMSLPPAGTRRWTAAQKAAVLRAIRDGSLSVEEATRRYMLSQEELAGWQAGFERDGLAGLQLKSMRHRRSRRTSNS
jgi:transposase